MIRKAGNADLARLAALSVMLWEKHTVSEMTETISKLMANESCVFFLKYEGALPAGFAQCQLRQDYVEGTKTSPVGYLEGIFVKEDCRGKGYGRELAEACEAWARERGCREFASDCEANRTESFLFHKALNFTEANRIICFTKPL